MKNRQFECSHCGKIHLNWSGKCHQCGEWNTLQPADKERLTETKAEAAEIKSLDGLGEQGFSIRLQSGVGEFDRVLGGGILAGSVGIIGGEPGIGKSTLILQLVNRYSSMETKTLYVTGEESLHQIKNRAERLGLNLERIHVMAETHLEKVMAGVEKFRPALVFIDSIHTLRSEAIPSAAGSVNQVREISDLLVAYAKKNHVSVILVGHVTKEGFLAGPKTLEHIVDYAVYFDGEKNDPLRILRAVKNRFGSLHEIGLFKMTQKGLVEAKNHNQIFRENQDGNRQGTALYPSQEGSRLMLVEVQALVSDRDGEYFSRTALGVERNKLLMINAILEKYVGVYLQGRDVYLNIAGGFKSNHPTIDMAIVAAILSSHRKIPLGAHSVFWGEVTLTGEFRASYGQEDLLEEVERFGFERIFMPARSFKSGERPSAPVIPVRNVRELSEILKG